MEVSKIIRYAFSRFKLGDVLQQGGSVVSLFQSFTHLASVTVEDVWMSLFSPANEHMDTLRIIAKTIGVLFNIAANCPLDVLRTRLAITDLYNPNRSRVVPFTPISAKKSITSTCKKMLAEEGWRSFYSGWEILVIDAIVDHLLGMWERAEIPPGKAIFSLIPVILRTLCRYTFLVMKVKANIRNDGFWTIFMNIYSTKGAYGFFVGWRLFMLKIPVYIFHLFLANALFMQLKTLFNPKTLPTITNDTTPSDKKSPLHRQSSFPPNNNQNAEITDDNETEDNIHNSDDEGETPPPNGEGVPERRRDGWYRVNSATF